MEVMLSTTDNPYDPFDEFNQWFNFDSTQGYNTLSMLARLVHSTDELGSFVHDEELHRVIDEVVELNLSGVHIKVTRET